MGILKRLVGRLTGPDPVEMAGRIGACIARQWEAVETADNAAAVAALKDLDREVREFVKTDGTAALFLAVGHWAARLAAGDEALRVAAFFADHNTLSDLVNSFGAEGKGAGVGLMWFEEGLNRAGLVMTPSYLDKTRAHLLNAPPAAPVPLTALAEVVWPISERETALREVLARTTGLSVHTVAWELFAVRDAGFEMGSNMVLGDMDRQDVLEKKIHELVNRRLGEVPVIANLAAWYTDRSHLYAKAIKNLREEKDSTVAAVKWLDHVRRAFQSCLGTDDAAVGQIGGAEYDRAMSRSMEICEGFDFSDASDQQPDVLTAEQVEQALSSQFTPLPGQGP